MSGENEDDLRLLIRELMDYGAGIQDFIPGDLNPIFKLAIVKTIREYLRAPQKPRQPVKAEYILENNGPMFSAIVLICGGIVGVFITQEVNFLFFFLFALGLCLVTLLTIIAENQTDNFNQAKEQYKKELLKYEQRLDIWNECSYSFKSGLVYYEPDNKQIDPFEFPHWLESQ